MTSWCKKRLTYKTLLVRFGDGKHRFYLESVCGGPISDPTSNLCAHCTGVVQQTKTQDVGTFPHGLVTGPYTKESHLYDSPWYLAKVAAYGAPSESDLEMAKKAQVVAKTGKKLKTIECIQKHDSLRVATIQLPAPNNPVLSLESSELLKVSNPVLSVKSSDLLIPNKVAEVKPKKKRAAPKKVLVVPELKPDTTVLAQLGAIHETIVTTIPDTSETKVETMDTPLEVKTVVRVSLRLFTHSTPHGTGTYWRDEVLEKLYKRKSDGGLGPYIGRWDSKQDTIVEDAPDSDEDC